MDLFKLLSRGANIHQKQKQELAKFTGRTEKNADAQDIDQRMDFFASGSKKKKPDSSQSETPVNHILKITNAEQAAEYRRLNKTKVTGEPPLPIASFDDLTSRYELNSKLRRNLEKMGFNLPTAIQSEAIPILLEEHDLLAVAPTGSGKTLAFVTPVVQSLISNYPRHKASKQQRKGPVALIVSPTRELAAQIYEVAAQLSKGNDLSVAILNKKQLAKMRNNNAGGKTNPDILISTPLRLIEAQKEQLLTLDSAEWLVLDEADKLLGEGFVEQTDEIIANCTNQHVVKAFFSATMPSHVEELAKTVTTDKLCRVIVGHKEGAAETVDQKLVYCGSEAGKLTAIRQSLAGGGVVPPILVFVQSIQRAKALFHELLYDKVNVDVIHSDLSQAQRERVVDQFKQGDIWVLICTDVLARGIDFQGINLVINYDVPQSAQSYVHRIGRTGRAGRQGQAVTYYTNQDIETLRPIVNVMKQSGVEVSDWLVSATTKGKPPVKNNKKKHHKPVKRSDISTVPKIVKQQKRQHQEMVEASKRRKNQS